MIPNPNLRFSFPLVYYMDLVEDVGLTAKILTGRLAAQIGLGLRHSYMP